MRAVVITRPGGQEVLEVQEVETPEPIGDYVRVRVRASGVNRADLLQRAGAYPAPAGSPSNIPGLEFAGEVDAVGPLVRMWKPGQRVMGLAGGGAQAQYIVVHEGLLVEIPDNLDFVQAAAVPEVFMTAHDALFTQAGFLRTRTLEEKLAVTRRFATSVLPLLASGKVKPIIEQVYAMEEVGNKAHAVMSENKNFGKLVVRVD